MYKYANCIVRSNVLPEWIYSYLLCVSLTAVGMKECLFSVVPLINVYVINVRIAVGMGQTCYTFRVRKISREDVSTVCGRVNVWRDVCDCVFLAVSSGESQCLCYLTTEVFHQKFSFRWLKCAPTLQYLAVYGGGQDTWVHSKTFYFGAQLRYTIPLFKGVQHKTYNTQKQSHTAYMTLLRANSHISPPEPLSPRLTSRCNNKCHINISTIIT